MPVSTTVGTGQHRQAIGSARRQGAELPGAHTGQPARDGQKRPLGAVVDDRLDRRSAAWSEKHSVARQERNQHTQDNLI